MVDKSVQATAKAASAGGNGDVKASSATIDEKKVPERLDTYKKWLGAQNIPFVRGYFIEDINKIELSHWEMKGVPAAFVILEGTGGTNDAYICEIPPGA